MGRHGSPSSPKSPESRVSFSPTSRASYSPTSRASYSLSQAEHPTPPQAEHLTPPQASPPKDTLLKGILKRWGKPRRRWEASPPKDTLLKGNDMLKIILTILVIPHHLKYVMKSMVPFLLFLFLFS